MAVVMETEIWRNKKTGEKVRVMKQCILSVHSFSEVVVYQTVDNDAGYYSDYWDMAYKDKFLSLYEKVEE